MTKNQIESAEQKPRNERRERAPRGSISKLFSIGRHRKYRWPKRLVERIVAISDIHFGEPTSTLSKAGTVDALENELSGDGKLSELILLGDVFDLWKATPSKAINDSKYFMSRVGVLADKVTYIVGNHDHHLFLTCQESEFLEELHEPEVKDPNFSPDQDFGSSILEDLISDRCELDVRYARYWKDHLGLRLLFMHGHHLDFWQTLAPNITNRIRLFLASILQKNGYERTRKILLDDKNFEIALASSYEPLYRNALMGEIVTVENGLWKIPSSLGVIKGYACKTFRFTPVQQMYWSIGRYLERFKERPDVFVYGHTHQADAYKKREEVLAVNTGCWLQEENPSIWNNPEEIPNTYVVIDEAVTVRQLGKKQPIAGPFPFDKVRTLEFGGRT
jgi:predicted phosphodiesterase